MQSTMQSLLKRSKDKTEHRPLLKLLICWLSGGAAGLCFLCPEAGPAVFFLAVPCLSILLAERDLLLLEKREGGRSLIKLCSAFCLGLCMAGYSPAFSIRTDVSEDLLFWIDLAIFLAICIFHGAILTAALWTGIRLLLPKAMCWISIAAFWTLGEWILGTGPLAWPTLWISLPLWKYPILIQLASFGGQLFVSFLIMAVNALLAEAVSSYIRTQRYDSSAVQLFHIRNIPVLASTLRKTSVLLPFCAAIAILGAILSLGAFRLNLAPDAASSEKVMNVAVIQPGLTAIVNDREGVYETALEMTAGAARTLTSANDDAEPPGSSHDAATKLILLPESILPSYFDEYPQMQTSWSSLASQSGAHILVGGSYEGRSTLYCFDPHRDLTDRYRKKREVPFFENGAKGKGFRFTQSNEANLLPLGAVQAGAMLCYESMFPAMARSAVNRNAEILMVPTNDSWFNAAAAKNLHLAHGVFRAVETGRPLIQAGLNGRTAIIELNGSITSIPEDTKASILYTDLILRTEQTLFLRIGNLWLAPALVVPLLMAAIPASKHRIRRPKL